MVYIIITLHNKMLRGLLLLSVPLIGALVYYDVGAFESAGEEIRETIARHQFVEKLSAFVSALLGKWKFISLIEI